MGLIVVVGARPNFIKAAPLVRALEGAGFDVDIAFTGSRGAHRQTDVHGDVRFFGVSVPAPRWFLDVGTGPQSAEMATALVALEELFSNERPDAVVVLGDANSSVAAAIAAAKCGIAVVHPEAGLRCDERGCAEEINRRLISCVTSLHLTPTEQAMSDLKREGVDEDRIHFVGSLMAESVLVHMEEIRHLDPASAHGLRPGGYVLASFHRPVNLESGDRLRGIVFGLAALGIDVLCPDPGSMERALLAEGVSVPDQLRIVSDVAYGEMLALERDAAVVVTDSGGVQEEACMLMTPCVTVRDSTEHSATIDVGANRLSAPNPQAIVDAVSEASSAPRKWVAPIRWDRSVSSRVVRVLRRGIPSLT